MNELSVVIPSYNEDHTILQRTKYEIEQFGAEVVIVDDGSENPFPGSIKHGANFGYGAALLTGIKNATRPVIMTIDGDGQHQVDDVRRMYKVWRMLDIDMLIGVRRLKHEKAIRFLGRKFLNIIASVLALYWLPDLNSGMRIFKRSTALGYAPILCKQFSFTTSITMSMMCDGLKVEWFPIQVRERAHGQSRVKVMRDGIVTLYYILRIGIALRTRGLRAALRGLRAVHS